MTENVFRVRLSKYSHLNIMWTDYEETNVAGTYAQPNPE